MANKNMSLTKTPMPEQDPNVRNRNFEEVALGYTQAMALEEAARCLNCKHMPCVSGCPVNVRIPEFIAAVADGDFRTAKNVLDTTNGLPAVCGRVCPQESQCESKCVRGIKGEPVGIGRLERFVADWARENPVELEVPASNGHKVAVLGAGPAGLTCANDLRRMGYDVTIFEAFHKAGGVLIYGIPEFRLPKAIVQAEVENLQKMGVEIQCNMVMGKVLTVEEIFEMGYEAIFIGTGAGLPSFLGIEGENSVGVFSANEYLTRINLMKAYDGKHDTPIMPIKKAVIVGGGNVAMDAARCAKRMGADTMIVYRRSLDELPARKEEVHHAMEEGIEFNLLTNPKRILADENGKVCGIVCAKMELGEPDESGRRRPVEIPGADVTIECDAVIVSIGTSPNPIMKENTKNLKTNRKGCIEADETGATSIPGVFAGGDAVTGAATVILAMGAGKTGAASIDAYIKAKNN